MRPKQPNHIAHFLALAVMAVMALTMPACQKARMQKKDGQPREVRVQPDQDSGRSADPAVIPQNPLQAYNRYIGQRQPPQGTPTGSQGNGAWDREDGEPPRENGAHSDDTEESPANAPVATGANGSPLTQGDFTVPKTPEEAEARQNERLVLYRQTQVKECSSSHCLQEPLPPVISTPAQTAPPCRESEETPSPSCAPQLPQIVLRARSEPQVPNITETFRQPNIPNHKVDLLFVVDTSDSLFGERNEILSNILPELIQPLADNLKQNNLDLDYKIGMILAHSPESKYSGKLYSVSDKTPIVIGNKTSPSMTNEEILEAIKARIKKMPGESGRYDAGEMGLLSLYKFLEGDALEYRQKNQFMREDAALMVIFISDENDICYHYKKGEKPNYNPKLHLNSPAVELFGIKGFDPKEADAFNNFCSELGKQPEQTVFKKLKEFKPQNGQLGISGVLYVDPRKVPKRKNGKSGRDRYYDENEMGRGYLDIISLANGTPIELADGQTQEVLNLLGKMVYNTMHFYNVFQLIKPGEMSTRKNPDTGQIEANFSVEIKRANGGEIINSHSYETRAIVDKKQIIITAKRSQGINPYSPQAGDEIKITWTPEVQGEDAPEATAAPNTQPVPEPTAGDGNSYPVERPEEATYIPTGTGTRTESDPSPAPGYPAPQVRSPRPNSTSPAKSTGAPIIRRDRPNSRYRAEPPSADSSRSQSQGSAPRPQWADPNGASSRGGDYY